MSLQWEKTADRQQKVGYKQVAIKTFTLPDGTTADYTTWYGTGSESVATVALTKEGNVVVARQYRPGPERVLDELPGGGIEAGESLAEAAARELLEETGYVSDEPFELVGSDCKDAYTNNTNHYFIARNCYLDGAQQLDDTEFVEVVTLSPQELINNAKTAKMSDASAVLMVYEVLLAMGKA